MANQTVYPYGTGGSLPSSIGIINDLKTGGADKALAAEQGKVIGGLLYESKQIDLSLFGYDRGLIGAGGTWTSTNLHHYTQIKVAPGEEYTIVAHATNYSSYAFLSELGNWEKSGTPPYATGESNRHDISAGSEVTITIPQGCNFLYIALYNASNPAVDLTPSSITLIKETSETISEEVAAVSSSLKSLEGEWNDLWDYSEAEVLSTDTNAITIVKSDGSIVIDNVSPANGKYALIKLPSTLVSGRTYQFSIEYTAGFANGGPTWWLGFCNSSYSLTSGGFNLKPCERFIDTISYTHAQANTYLRLVSLSQNQGAKVNIHSISIYDNKTTVAEISNRIDALEEGGNDNEMDNIIRQAKMVASGNPSLGLLHFSDIHGDTLAAMQIKAFYQKYSNYIDDIIQTGDTVYYYWDSAGQGYEWYQQHGIPEALFVIGNHDGAANSDANGWLEGSADWDFKGKEWDFDTYFANYISTRGVVPPVGYDDSTSDYYKALYWHKDYPNSKVRVIGLDCLHFNDTVRYLKSDQETWLAARLAETLNSSNSAYGYSVIVLCHYPIDDLNGDNETWNDGSHKFVYNKNQNGGVVMDRNTGLMTTFHGGGNSMTMEKKFCMRDRVGEVGSKNYTRGNNNPLAEIIQTWVNNGGKFIAWLSGHTHADYMYYSTKYPGLLCVGLQQAGNTRGNSEADRTDGSPMHPCANLYFIDTNLKIFKIIRFGCTLTRTLMKVETISYFYESKITGRK